MDQTQKPLPTSFTLETTTLQLSSSSIVKRVFKEAKTGVDPEVAKASGVWFFELEENPKKIEKLARAHNTLVSIKGNEQKVLKQPYIPLLVAHVNEEVYTYYQNVINQIRVRLLSFPYSSNIYLGFEIDTEVGKTNTRTLRKLCEGLVDDLYTVRPTMTIWYNPFFLDTDLFNALYELNRLIRPLPTDYYVIDNWLAVVAKYQCLLDGLTELGNAIMNTHDSLRKIGREICVTVRLIRNFYAQMVEREKELRGYNDPITT